MTENNDKEEQDVAPEEPEGPIGGERLAEARREREITVLEIAKELHLDEYKVRALERNDFETLGAPVFAKGHLKKYAQLVAIDEADVLTDYYRLTRAAEIPPVVSIRRRPRKEMSPGPWIAVVVIIVVVVSAYWWFTSRPLDSPAPEPAAVEQPAEPEAGDDDAESPVPAVDDTVAGEPPVDEPVSGQSRDATIDLQPAAADDGQLRVVISYSGDCWTEISDATGRRLFFGLGSDGRTVELSGAQPFNALFGNADNVALEVDGSDFAIPASARRGRTARLTISSP